MKYEWSASRHTASKKEAQLLGEQIEKLKTQGVNDVPEHLVRLAKPASSPTHHLFEWDDAKAAHEYRLHQARNYIRSLTIVLEETNEPIRAFASVTIDGHRTYAPIRQVLSDKDIAQQLLSDAKSEAESWARRYEVLKRAGEMLGVFRAIEQELGPKKALAKTKRGKDKGQAA